jgi:ABC-type glycerol-3-phosphate transport system substrate-binding protein
VIAAVVSGSAVAAVVPVGDLAKLPRDAGTGAVEARFAVAPVPGADAYYDVAGKRQKSTSVNRVPLYAGGGLAGVVRQSAAHPDAAWALLAELGGPAGSAASVADAGVGGGPLRIDHATPSTAHWEQYGFDTARTADLTAAVNEYVAPGTINPAVALRTPDVDAVNALLAKAVTEVASGRQTADAGQRQAVADWQALDAKTPADARQLPRRKSAGLD